MGRAIDMEKDIDSLKLRVDKLENVVRGMTHRLDETDEKSSKTTHVDLIDKEQTEKINDKEEKTNDEASGKRNKPDNKNVGKPKRKNK